MRLQNITKTFYKNKENEIAALSNLNLELIDEGLILI
ncbi:Uncharacterised protein [Haploplasma axanthum]|uniref:Uncharacterized protein n=1 Tax=Haploplasma axanthum TaxID=29552 RepID=A0A449BGA2_HAPAX|nr:Uncharacterised protein [Haploplasma axanthum]